MKNNSLLFRLTLTLFLSTASICMHGASNYSLNVSDEGNGKLSPLNFSKGKLSTGDTLNGKLFTCKNEWIEIREEFQVEKQFAWIIADGLVYRKNIDRPQVMFPETQKFDITNLNRVSLIRKWKKYNEYILYSEFILPNYDLETPFQILDPNTGMVYDSTDQYGAPVFPPHQKPSSHFRIHNLKTGKTTELNNASFFMQSKEKVWISYFDAFFGQYPLFSLYDLKTESFSFVGISVASLWKYQDKIAGYPELKDITILSRKIKELNPENTCTIVSENGMSLMNMIHLQGIPSVSYEWMKESIDGLRMVYAKGKFGIEDEQGRLLFPLSSDSIALWTESYDHNEQVWSKIYHNGNIYHYHKGKVPVLEKNAHVTPYRYSAQSTAYKSSAFILFSSFDASAILDHRPYLSVFADVEMMDSLDAMGNPVYPPKPPLAKEIEAYDLLNHKIVFTDSLSTRVSITPMKMKYSIQFENINRFEPYSYHYATKELIGDYILWREVYPIDSLLTKHLHFLGYVHPIHSISFIQDDSTKVLIETPKGFGIYDISQARWLISPQYEHIRYLAPFDAYLVSCGGKMGMTDAWGTPLFPVDYKSISYNPYKDYFILDEHHYVYRNPQYAILRGVMAEDEVVQTRGFSDVNQSFLEAKIFEGRILLSYGNRVVGPLEVFDPETGDQFLIEDTKEIISKYGYKQYGINEEIGKKTLPESKLNQHFQIEFRNAYFLSSNASGNFYLYNQKWQCFDSAQRGSLTLLGTSTLVQGTKQIAFGSESHDVVDSHYDAGMYSEMPPYIVTDARLYSNADLLQFPDGFIPFRLLTENLVHAVKKEKNGDKEILKHQLFFITPQQKLMALDPAIDAWSMAYTCTGKSIILGNTSQTGEIIYRLLDVSKAIPTAGTPFSAELLRKGEKVAYLMEKTDKGYDLYSCDKQLVKSGLTAIPNWYVATDSTLHFEISGKWYTFLHNKESNANAVLQVVYFGENEVGRYFFYRTQNEKIELINQKGETIALSKWNGNNSAELVTADGLDNSYFLKDTISKKNYLVRWNKTNTPEFVFSEPVDSFKTIHANIDTRVLIWTNGETHVCDRYWNVLMSLPYTAETKTSEMGLNLLLLRPKNSKEPYRVFHPTDCTLSNTTYPDKGIDFSYNEVENIGELWVTGMENNTYMMYSYLFDGTLQLSGKKTIAKGDITPLPYASYWISKKNQGELYYLGPDYEFRDTFAFGKLTIMSDNLHFLASDRANKFARLYQLNAETYIEIPIPDLDSAMEYGNSSIIQIWKNNKSGLYFPNINKVLPPVYSQVVGPFNEAMHLITCDGHLISTLTGEIIFNKEFKRCEFPEGKYLLAQHQDGSWWICNNQPNSENFLKKKQLPSNIKKWVGFAGIDDWHKFMDQSGMIGIYNVKTNQWIIQPKFKDVRAAYAGNHTCFFFSQGSYWGVCDSSGKIILPDTYDNIDLQEAYPSGKLYFTTRKNGQYTIFSIQGKALLPASYPEIDGGNYPVVLVTSFAQDKQTPLTGLYDVEKGKWLYPLSKVDYVIAEDEKGKKVIYVEQNGKRIKVIYP